MPVPKFSLDTVKVVITDPKMERYWIPQSYTIPFKNYQYIWDSGKWFNDKGKQMPYLKLLKNVKQRPQAAKSPFQTNKITPLWAYTSSIFKVFI